MSEDLLLHQDSHISKAERIDGIVSVLTMKENEEEEEDFHAVRRMKIQGKSEGDVPDNILDFQSYEVPGHLKKLYDKSTNGKSESEKKTVAGMLNKYSETFSKDEWDVCLTNLVEHLLTRMRQHLSSKEAGSPRICGRRKSSNDLLKKGVVQKSTSPWESSIVFVRKTAGAVRPCVDYRKVNALVKPDGFPLSQGPRLSRLCCRDDYV